MALHFNPRFGDREVVCNSREGGNWQEEVTKQREDFPFEKKDAFEVAISVKDDKFVVSFQVKSRLPIKLVLCVICVSCTHVWVKGNMGQTLIPQNYHQSHLNN